VFDGLDCLAHLRNVTWVIAITIRVRRSRLLSVQCTQASIFSSETTEPNGTNLAGNGSWEKEVQISRNEVDPPCGWAIRED